MVNKLVFPILTMALLASGCGKKTKTVADLYEAKDTDGLTALVDKGTDDAATLTQATYALIRLGRVVRAAKSFSTLNTKNPDKAGAVLTAIHPLLIKLLEDQNLGVSSKDALFAMARFMTPKMEASSATAAFAWFAKDMENRMEKGDFKFFRALETLWNRLPEKDRGSLATAHARYIRKDLKTRGPAAVDLQKRAGLHKKPEARSKLQQIYGTYFEALRIQLVKQTIENFSTTRPNADQLADLALLNTFATPHEKKSAGEKILQIMIKTKQFKIVSLRALGTLKPQGAALFLANFIKPGTNSSIRLAAHEALAMLLEDPLSMELLYEEFKPFLTDLKNQRSSSEEVAKIAKSAAKGLFYNRSCQMKSEEFDFLRAIYTMPLKGELFEARDSIKPILYRLLLCTGQDKALKLLLPTANNTLNFNVLTKIIDSFGSMDKKILLPALRKNITSKKIEVIIPAIWGLSGFGEKNDIPLLSPFLLDGRPIANWGKTVGEFTTSVKAAMENRLLKSK